MKNELEKYNKWGAENEKEEKLSERMSRNCSKQRGQCDVY